MTYGSQIIANLRDLIGPASLVNTRINLACAYSELEGLLSNLLPPPVRAAALLDDMDRVASDCCCLEAITGLRRAADVARCSECSTVSADTLAAAVADVELFVVRMHALSYPVPCACGASVEYRLGDALGLTPPDRFRLACASCGRDTTWFIPSPRH